MNTPKDILKYVIDNNLEFDFMTSIAKHKNNYSIAEITDKKLEYKDNICRLRSANYNINIRVEDDEIITATINKLYVSAFISRKDDNYQVHFLVHKYPESMKEKYEDQISHEVIQYMILRGIVAMRLDTEKKIDDYVGENDLTQGKIN